MKGLIANQTTHFTRSEREQLAHRSECLPGVGRLEASWCPWRAGWAGGCPRKSVIPWQKSLYFRYISLSYTVWQTNLKCHGGIWKPRRVKCGPKFQTKPRI